MVDMQNKGVKLAIALLVVGVIVAFTIPIAIDALNSDKSINLNQTTGQNYTVTGPLDSEITNVDDTGNTVSYTLYDTEEGTSQTVSSQSVGASNTVTMPDGDITVTVDSITTANSARMNYTYDETYGWSDGSSALYNLLPLLFVLAIVMYVVRKAT